MNARGRKAGAKIMERYGKKGIKKLAGRKSSEGRSSSNESPHSSLLKTKAFPMHGTLHLLTTKEDSMPTSGQQPGTMPTEVSGDLQDAQQSNQSFLNDGSVSQPGLTKTLSPRFMANHSALKDQVLAVGWGNPASMRGSGGQFAGGLDGASLDEKSHSNISLKDIEKRALPSSRDRQPLQLASQTLSKESTLYVNSRSNNSIEGVKSIEMRLPNDKSKTQLL